MRPALRRPRPCIFCTFRHTRDFSTTASLGERDFGRRSARSSNEYESETRSSTGRSRRNQDEEEDAPRFSMNREKRWELRDRQRQRENEQERRTDPRARMRFLEVQSNVKSAYKAFALPKEGFRRTATRGDSSQRNGQNRQRTGAKKDFGESLHEALKTLEEGPGQDWKAHETFKRLDMDSDKIKAEFDVFKYKVLQSQKADTSTKTKASDLNLHYMRLKKVFKTTDSTGFNLEVKYAFYGYLVSPNFTKKDLEYQASLANLRFPTEWFPATRAWYRNIHLHVGPTNSGKTYHALKRLEEAETGIYAGPLRLLAHEVYMRLNARGKRCNLITGDDRRIPVGHDSVDAEMSSCTVEMIPLNTVLDVAVIDEIQMIGSEDRGWAWTQAVLGVKAKELHLCGEERAVPIIKELAALCGDKLHIHRYERLSPLQMATESLDGNLRNLQKGDCIVAFSIVEIHGLRQIIEKTLKCKVAIIYGSLPPETRAQQAQLFNDPDSGYDILVASNAIGMGLNLSIKRLIFHTAHRYNGTTFEPLAIAETKQIAGRAGRYRTAAQAIKKDLASNLDLVGPGVSAETSETETSVTPAPPPTPAAPEEQTVGLVTTLDKLDFPVISRAMASDPEPMTSAGIQPPAYIIERFARYYPAGTPFAYLLIRLNELAKTSGRFHLCDLRQAIAIADAIEPVEGLTTTDKLIFVSSPIEPRKNESALARTYAQLIAQNKGVSIAEIKELDLELLKEDYTANRGYLQKLEALHKGVIVWMWLSYRFMGIFINRELAAHVKEMVEKRIEDVLQRMSFDFNNMKKRRERAILDMLENEAKQEEGEEQTKSENETGDELEKMPEDPKEMSEWLRGLASKETGSGVEMPISDVVPQQPNEEEDVLLLSDREVLEAGEPSSAVASESLIEDIPSERHDSASPVDEAALDHDGNVVDGREKSSPFTPPAAPSSDRSMPINPNFSL